MSNFDRNASTSLLIRNVWICASTAISEGYGAAIGDGVDGTNNIEKYGFSTGNEGHAIVFLNDNYFNNYISTDWKGIVFNGNKGNIYGDTVYIQDSFTIGSIFSLIIKEDQTLSLGVNVKITIVDGGILYNNGMIQNYGGTIDGEIEGNQIPSIDETSPVDGRVGMPYRFYLGYEGSADSFTLYNSRLPRGLSLVGSSITGTPLESGEFTFSVKASSSGGFDVVEFTMTIEPNPAIVVDDDDYFFPIIVQEEDSGDDMVKVTACAAAAAAAAILAAFLIMDRKK